MAMRRAGEPRRSAQIIFMIEEEIAGEVEAWRIKRGIDNKSVNYREIFLAGLAAKSQEWAAEHGNLARGAAKRYAPAAVAEREAAQLAAGKPAKKTAATSPGRSPAKRTSKAVKRAAA